MDEELFLRTCCSCNFFPKFKKNWDPPLIRFAQFFGFAWCLRKDYIDCSDFLWFELILPCCQKHVRFLSRESSYLHARRCGKEHDIKSELSVFGLRCIFLCRQLFWDPVGTFVYTSSTIAEKVLQSFPRSCLIIFRSPSLLIHRSFVF